MVDSLVELFGNVGGVERLGQHRAQRLLPAVGVHHVHGQAVLRHPSSNPRPASGADQYL